MTLYLTDLTAPAEIAKTKESDFVHAVMYYPAEAISRSENGVTDIERVYLAFAEMERYGLPRMLHGKVTDLGEDVFARDAVFLKRHLAPLACFPTFAWC
jgi:dihydroorotase